MPKKRRESNKKLKPVLHIFCEGEKTEPNYINGYVQSRHPTNRLLKVIKVEKTRKNTPIQLVKEAIKLKNDKLTPDKDIFWVVYDREEVSKYNNKLHQEALDKANSKNINVALTNVCFEVWLILHFSELTASYISFSDLIKNSVLKDELKKIGISDYDKADRHLFDLIVESIPEARRRAIKMNQATLVSSYETEDKPYLLNPYTGMHNLLDAIDDFVEKS